MKHQRYLDDMVTDLDELSPVLTAHLEHLSRKWADEDHRPNRLHRRGLTRRRIEDWREDQALRRELDGDLELN